MKGIKVEAMPDTGAWTLVWKAGGKTMGNVYAEITVTNTSDMVEARKGHISEKDIRSVTLNALVDTGATTLVINEEVSRQLGLFIREERTANLASGIKGSCKITERVQIQWKDRYANVSAVVFPEGSPLLGVIPLEFMDLTVDPIRRELVGAHGDQPVMMVMQAEDSARCQARIACP
jgi:clan AA aspartic protease